MIPDRLDLLPVFPLAAPVNNPRFIDTIPVFWYSRIIENLLATDRQRFSLARRGSDGQSVYVA